MQSNSSINNSVKDDLLKSEIENNHMRIMLGLSILLGSIIVFGTLANIINIIIFSRKSMRKNSTFRFLFYLSANDLLVLLISALEAFDRGIGHRLKLREISNFSCKTHTFLTYVLTHTSSILLMVISIDRALVISDTTILGIFKALRCFNRSEKYSKSHKSIKIKNNITKRSKNNLCFDKASMHNVDLIVLIIVVTFLILNSHYLIFLNLNVVYSNPEEANTLIDYANRQIINISSVEYSDYRYECHPLADTFYRQFLDKYWNWIGEIKFFLKIFRS